MCQVPASQLKTQVNHNEMVTNKLEVRPPSSPPLSPPSPSSLSLSFLLLFFTSFSLLLKELLLEYKNSSLPKDRWRAMSLTKALAAVRRHPKEISSYEVK